jgi:hypothetical protein
MCAVYWKVSGEVVPHGDYSRDATGMRNGWSYREIKGPVASKAEITAGVVRCWRVK